MAIAYKKSLGQNFLRDPLFLERIISSSEIQNLNNVIEIGSGDGALTEYILEQTKNLTAYEIDNDLFKILLKKFKMHDVNFINEDFLKINLSEIRKNHLIIMGNLPYNVSSQIILKILESDIEYDHCIFLIQKELAQRFNYGNKSCKISLIAELFCDFEILFDIPPEAFFPEPKVDSKIIVFKPKDKIKFNISNIENLEKITQIFFSSKRITYTFYRF